MFTDKDKIIKVNIYRKLERIFLRCLSIHLLSVLRTIYVLAGRAILLDLLLLLLTLNPRNIHIFKSSWSQNFIIFQMQILPSRTYTYLVHNVITKNYQYNYFSYVKLKKIYPVILKYAYTKFKACCFILSRND